MKLYTLLILSLFSIQILSAQNPFESYISTQDIDNFWVAFDQLSTAKTKKDSIAIIQKGYIDKASDGFKRFLKVRDFTAPEYIHLIQKYPKFWPSVRPKTLAIAAQQKEIIEVYEAYLKSYPKLNPPNICFAIGCLRTGGTTSKGWMHIGAEIVCADEDVDKSELNNWLKAVMPKKPQIKEMIAHEMVHTQQKKNLGIIWGFFNHRLLTMAFLEGGADFAAMKITQTQINENIYAYGNAHEQELWEVFQKEMLGNDISNWMYQGNSAKDMPADLGYFIGYKICEAYYEQAPDKEEALKQIIESSMPPKKWLKKSKYSE